MANNQFIGTGSTWTTTTHWSAGHPATTNEFTLLSGAAAAISAGLAQGAVVVGSLNQDMSFTGSLGTNGTSNTYLQIASPVSNLGIISPSTTTSGSRAFNLDVGTSSSVINVMNTAQSGTSGAPVKLLCTNATVNLTGGIVSIAALASETATVNTLNVASSGTGVSPQAYLGPGCTVTTLAQNNAGAVTSASQALVTTATLTGSNAQLNHIGSGGISALTIANGAKVTYTGSGSINSMVLAGTLDMSGGGSTVHLGSGTLTVGAKIIDPLRRLVFDTALVRTLVAWKDVYIDRGIAGGGTF